MSNAILKTEFDQIIKTAPADMKLPIYIGKHCKDHIFYDLAELKSIAMYGEIGISAVCTTSLFSMLKARENEIRNDYFLSICYDVAYSWTFQDIPFANEYISNTCTGIYSLVHYYSMVKQTLETFAKENAERYARYKEILAKNPRLYIFEGYRGPLCQETIESIGLDLELVKEAFQNAYKYNIYILIPNCFRPENTLAHYIHTSVRIKKTIQGHSADILQNNKVLMCDIQMNWLSYNDGIDCIFH